MNTLKCHTHWIKNSLEKDDFAVQQNDGINDYQLPHFFFFKSLVLIIIGYFEESHMIITLSRGFTFSG